MMPMLSRAEVVAKFMVDRLHYGVPEVLGPVDREVLFLVDGVGRFQAAVLMARRALRDLGSDMGTVFYDWQTPLVGEVLSDLMWYRRNRLMGARLGRKLLAFRRQHPQARIHMLAYSGGAGIAVFALEALRGRSMIGTLILACPAMSSTYNFAPALRTVTRCYALISHRDRVILGLGTRIFGTTDRRHESAGGRVGFCVPADVSDEDADVYHRMRQIRWTPDLKELGHPGGHTGWASDRFLYKHLIPLLQGDPHLPSDRIRARLDACDSC